MAYGLLASVPAVVGLYTSFWPVLVYFFLGTSKHNSMGRLDLNYILSQSHRSYYWDIGIFKKLKQVFSSLTLLSLFSKKNKLIMPIEL